MNVGIRVAAVSADQKTFLGYGTYLGDFLNPGRALPGHMEGAIEGGKAK